MCADDVTCLDPGAGDAGVLVRMVVETVDQVDDTLCSMGASRPSASEPGPKGGGLMLDDGTPGLDKESLPPCIEDVLCRMKSPIIDLPADSGWGSGRQATVCLGVHGQRAG